MKKAKRSRGHQPTYTLLHELQASPTQPVAEHLMAAHLAIVNAGLLALQRDAAPSVQDWGCLSDAVNMLSSLHELGYIADEGDEITKAKDAMGEAGERHLAGGTLRLTGPGIATLRALLDDYEPIARALSARQFIRCVRHAERRALEILRGKTKSGDKVVAL